MYLLPQLGQKHVACAEQLMCHCWQMGRASTESSSPACAAGKGLHTVLWYGWALEQLLPRLPQTQRLLDTIPGLV